MKTLEQTGQTSNRRLRDRLLGGIERDERWLDVDGANTLVVECGQGPPLVLLHGGIECGGAYWGPVLPNLARDYRLILPDVPGLGESEPIERLDDEAFAAWFGAVLSTCGARPIVVAHSLNGSMATRFAGSSDALERLIVYAAPGIGRYHMPFGLRAVAIRFALRPTERNAERFDRWAFADYDAVRAKSQDWMAAFSEYSRERATVGHVKRAMRQLISIGTRRIPDDDLRRITAPVTMLWPRHDRFVPLALAESASARLGWRLHVIEDAGHAAHIEQPDAFVRALRQALDAPVVRVT